MLIVSGISILRSLSYSIKLCFSSEKPTPSSKVPEQQLPQPLQPLKPSAVPGVPPVVVVGVGPPGIPNVVVVGGDRTGGVPVGAPGALPPTPGGPPMPTAGPGGYGMYPFYSQSQYMMGQDPLTGGPVGPPGGPLGPPPPTVGPVGPGAVQPGAMAANLCDYKGAKEPPPLDLMTKPSAIPSSGPPQQQHMAQGPPAPSGPSMQQQQQLQQQHQQPPGSGDPTSPMKDFPGSLAASLAAQQQQAKVLSHYYPYK